MAIARWSVLTTFIVFVFLMTHSMLGIAVVDLSEDLKFERGQESLIGEELKRREDHELPIHYRSAEQVLDH